MSGRQLLRGFTRCLKQLLPAGLCLACGCDPGAAGFTLLELSRAPADGAKPLSFPAASPTRSTA